MFGKLSTARGSARLQLNSLLKGDLLPMVLLVVAAAAVRVYSLQFFDVIPTDGTTYVETARDLHRGDWSGVAVSGLYPVLIAVAGWLITDMESAGQYVSLFFGSLLPLPLFLLGKELFSRRVAFAASLIVIVSPVLISSSCQVITQATYTTFQLFGILLVWQLFRKPSILNGSLAGLCLGATFFTRPEGVLLFLVLPLPLLLFQLREFKKKWSPLAAYAGGFMLLFGLNMLLIHAATGEWQLSAKTDSALNDALSYYLKKPDLIHVPGYDPKGYLDILREYPDFVLKNSMDNLKKSWETVLPFWGWFLLIAGFFSGGFSSKKNMARFFLLSSMAPLAVIIVFYYISSGYTEAYLPILFLWAAAGFDRLYGFFSERLIPAGSLVWQERLARFPATVIAAAIYALLLFMPQIREPVSDENYQPASDNYRRDEKNIGLLLKDALPPGKIMTRWARIAFYAQREWISIPAGTPYEEIIELARKNSVRFFIADGTLYGNRPMLGVELFEPLMYQGQPPGCFFHDNPAVRVKGLRPYMLFVNPRSMGVVVYEIVPEQG